MAGCALYKDFTVAIKLTENKRLDATDPDSVIFDQYLDRLRDGDNTEEDWNTLHEKCSLFAMRMTSWWKNNGFNNDDVTHLYCTKKKGWMKKSLLHLCDVCRFTVTVCMY